MSRWWSAIVYYLCSAGSYLRKGAIVPEVALVWEAVADETKFALLDVLLDGVQESALAVSNPFDSIKAL